MAAPQYELAFARHFEDVSIGTLLTLAAQFASAIRREFLSGHDQVDATGPILVEAKRSAGSSRAPRQRAHRRAGEPGGAGPQGNV